MLERNDFALKNGEIFYLENKSLHEIFIQIFVALSAQSLNSRSFSSVQNSVLDRSKICRSSHRTAQHIDFAHELPFRLTADRRVARHLPYFVDRDRDEQSFRFSSRRSVSSFDPGMAAADNYDIKIFHKDL